MLAHTFTAFSGKYGVSAANAAFPDKTSATSKLWHQLCAVFGCKDTKLFWIFYYKRVEKFNGLLFFT